MNVCPRFGEIFSVCSKDIVHKNSRDGQSDIIHLTTTAAAFNASRTFASKWSFIYFLWHFLQNSVCNASAYCLHQGSRNNLSDPHELVQTLVKVLVGSCLRTFVLCLMIQFVSHTYKECDLNVSTAGTTKKC